MADFLMWDPLFLQSSTEVRSQFSHDIPVHSIFNWPFMPAEGLPNSQSDRVFPSPPDCRGPVSVPAPLHFSPKARSCSEEKLLMILRQPSPSVPLLTRALPGLAHQGWFRTASVKAVRVQTWGWGEVGKAVPGPVTHRECHCNANSWQDRYH